MNTYTVTTPEREPAVIDAHDWATEGGLVIFQDPIGRAITAVAISDGLRIDCAYDDDDELFEARTRLAATQRQANLAGIEAEIVRLNAPPAPPENRETRRASGRR